MSTQALPAIVQTFVLNRDPIKIYYPQVIGLSDIQVQQTVNQKILQTIQTMIQDQYVQQHANKFAQMLGTFEIKNNQRGIFSLAFSNYAIASQHANGLTIMKPLTFNMQTGKEEKLHTLFKPNSNYVDVLSRHVEQQIKTRNIPLINSFSRIKENQDFYVADKTLVLYFQLYELTPHYFGFPIFPISVYTLEDIIPDDGVLASLATNS